MGSMPDRNEGSASTARSAGDYFYRVRAVIGKNTSDWSNVVVVRVGGDASWQTEAAESYRDDTLVAVHRALLRMCAGRGDFLAVLSLPVHYREEQAMAHAGRLQTFLETEVLETEREPQVVRPLDRSEARALSYGALYHPWFTIRRAEGALQEISPDGAVCGVVASRAASRGAWVAPANEPLRDALVLTPQVLPENWQGLQNAQVNVVRRDPRGFLCLSADTLSRDPDLRVVLGGGQCRVVHAAQFFHHGSMTIRQDPAAAHHVNHWFRLNHAYFSRKWGVSTPAGSSSDVLARYYRHPFNDPSLSITWFPEDGNP
jgi:hypothetical protein